MINGKGYKICFPEGTSNVWEVLRPKELGLRLNPKYPPQNVYEMGVDDIFTKRLRAERIVQEQDNV